MVPFCHVRISLEVALSALYKFVITVTEDAYDWNLFHLLFFCAFWESPRQQLIPSLRKSEYFIKEGKAKHQRETFSSQAGNKAEAVLIRQRNNRPNHSQRTVELSSNMPHHRLYENIIILHFILFFPIISRIKFVIPANKVVSNSCVNSSWAHTVLHTFCQI